MVSNSKRLISSFIRTYPNMSKVTQEENRYMDIHTYTAITLPHLYNTLQVNTVYENCGIKSEVYCTHSILKILVHTFLLYLPRRTS